MLHVRARHETKDDPTLVLGSDHGAQEARPSEAPRQAIDIQAPSYEGIPYPRKDGTA